MILEKNSIRLKTLNTLKTTIKGICSKKLTFIKFYAIIMFFGRYVPHTKYTDISDTQRTPASILYGAQLLDFYAYFMQIFGIKNKLKSRIL